MPASMYTAVLPRALSRLSNTSSPRVHICRNSGLRTRISSIRLPCARWWVPRVEPLRDHGIDTVVLGCTHFPLLVGPIRHALGPGVRVVSSAEETTRELTDILTRREQLAGDAAEPQHRFATTADNIAEFAVAGSFIFGQPLKSIEHIDIDELK